MQPRWIRQSLLATGVAFGVVFAYGILADDRDLSRIGSTITNGGAKIIRLGRGEGESFACHPSYRGQCIPSYVWDADCAGGGGNGPAFVQGTVRVVGPDVFLLDEDGDGRACEPLPY
jgi:hypothetical protein